MECVLEDATGIAIMATLPPLQRLQIKRLIRFLLPA